MVGVETDLRGKVKRHRQSGRPVAQKVLVAFVGLLGIAHACILAHGPQSPPIHSWLHAASVRKIARIAGLFVVLPIVQINRGIKLANWYVRRGFRIYGRGKRFGLFRQGYFLRRTLEKELNPNQANSSVNPAAAATFDPGALPA